MSLSRGCEIIELTPGAWHCVVASDEHDYDFENGSTVYGPANSSDAALEMMNRRESNPGSFNIIHHGDVGERERSLVKDSVTISIPSPPWSNSSYRPNYL